MIPANQEIIRNPDGTFPKGTSGNPNGRPKGKTMKEFAREFLMSMSDEEKREWMKDLGKDTVWKMAEGMPKQDNDITSGGKPIIIVPSAVAETFNIQADESNGETGTGNQG